MDLHSVVETEKIEYKPQTIDLIWRIGRRRDAQTVNAIKQQQKKTSQVSRSFAVRCSHTTRKGLILSYFNVLERSLLGKVAKQP